MKRLIDLLSRAPRPVWYVLGGLLAIIVLAALLPGEAGEPARAMLSTLWEAVTGGE